ncbi:M1 family peptidase [Granulicella sp. WH15]|uniref:M1 family metallopeptidase n=1 Tax=Granulicella sp. WH15 TaxID=2602070 RepID=UPI001367732F|nr:M1 family metallopeptidase [Granulicella sp. WH15]QHN05065.1 M1 family peptidase [Granulicella sp. WH15]
MTLRNTLLTLALAAAAPLTAQRLPANVHPEHYRLQLAPSIAQASFAGSETIDVTLADPSATVTLNALELKISKVEASTAAGTQTGTISYDPAKEQATFTFPQPLPAGHASLAVEFSGTLNDKLRGFYLSKTKARNYAVTQFESTDARRAFPSFDEPALKATFDVSLTIDAADTAISNGPIVSDQPGPAPGKHTLVFATTPKMSTYLVAFLVGDFACSKGKSDGVPIRVCATPDKLPLTKFAVSAAEHFLHYYDTYFGIKYPMAKLDLIGIPDFEAGAMENFGAITYRETDLLVDEKNAGINSRKRVASVVAHEMAHQWFGDMVTMQWWDNLWLNEGFATWMADKASGEWKPEWNFPEDTADTLDQTLNYDAGKTTRTIRATADTPAEIEEMFDGIAYGKAGAVLGMVENYLGAETFRQGVHNYLAAHLYANATAEDFWSAQTANSHQPVDRIMSSFVTQPGVPLLRFRDIQSAGVPVTQSRFFLSGMSPTSDSIVGWTIPVCVKTSGAPSCKILTPDAATLPIDPAPFFYANAADKGYFRTAYTPAQMKAILPHVESSLSPSERLGLLGDRWALTTAGEVPVGDYLDLALSVKSDPRASVLDSTLRAIDTIRLRLASPAERAQFDAILRARYAPVYAALATPGKHSTYDQQEIRSNLFGLLGAVGDPATLAEARRISDEVFAGHQPKSGPDADVTDAAILISAEHGEAALYDRIQAVSQKATDPELQVEALRTLTRFHDPALVTRTLDYTVSGAVRSQDSWQLIGIELRQPETRDRAWEWLQQNWDKVKAQLTVASGARVVTATGAFCTVEQRDQVTSFFATHKVDATERTLAKAIDSINDCIRFRAAQEPNLSLWLAAQPQ